jgi:dolichyl-phosphate-mannose-protein mannosyltransferase
MIPYQVDKLSHDEKETKVMAKQKTGDDSGPPRHPVNWAFVALLTVAAYISRFYKISAGSFVLWDEAHFGKFSNYYLRRTFYFDVHPPLAKMLVALGGYLAGIDSSFEFPSGTAYPEGFNYVFMRMFVATFGTLIVPFTYLTAVQLRLGKYAAYLCAAMALFGKSH